MNNNIFLAYDSSALSELSSSGCGNGCGTTSEERTDSSDEDQMPHKKRKTDDNDAPVGTSKVQRKHSQRALRGKGGSGRGRKPSSTKGKGNSQSHQNRIGTAQSEPGTSQDNGYYFVSNIK